MSKLRFDGRGAGLGQRLGGDANSPTDYILICSCEAELGPLARFPERDENNRAVQSGGIRQATCGRCAQTTLVRGTQIVGVISPEQMVGLLERQAQRIAARQAEERQELVASGLGVREMVGRR